LKRGDLPASISLLRRGTATLPASSPNQGAFLCELGIPLGAAGHTNEAIDVLKRAIEHARAIHEPRIEMRARMELEYLQTRSISGSTGDALLDVTSAAMDVFEVAGDERSVGRAWLLAGWVQGARRGQHRAREEAAEEALVHYERSTWPILTAVGEIADALYHGPAWVPDAIDRCRALLEATALDRYAQAHVEDCLGGLLAQRGAFDEARDHLASARETFGGLGHRSAAATFSAAIISDVERLAGNLNSAETTLRWLCNELTEMNAYSHLASRAGDLADVLYLLERLDESYEWTTVAETHSATDDVDALIRWMPVRAKLEAREGALKSALALVEDAVELAGGTDALNCHAKVRLGHGTVLLIAGREDDARSAFGVALELYEQKGNVVAASHARSLLDDLALV